MTGARAAGGTHAARVGTAPRPLPAPRHGSAHGGGWEWRHERQWRSCMSQAMTDNMTDRLNATHDLVASDQVEGTAVYSPSGKNWAR
ncbi:hypothetical protein RAA17_14580 [Komagataeibacter rhaeticus]|nr:hypothetical protein [Komagataeibacter rhaeticus]